MKNNSIHHAPYLRNSIAYDHVFWYTCVKWWYLQIFFQFFKILTFWVVSGVKGQKMAQIEKNIYLSCSISQIPYIIRFSFMVHMYKMIISLGSFFIFSKFWFFGLSGGKKGQKIVQNYQKFCLSCSISQNSYIIWSSFVVCKCKMIISSSLFFLHFFQNFNFSGC